MRIFHRSLPTLALLLILTEPNYADQVTNKKICLLTFGMNWKTSEEAQRHLVTLAKREAVGELFGELILSRTESNQFILTRDQIRSSSAGLVRMRGTPEFFNGASLGEICVAAELYVPQEDINRLQPRQVSKRVCIADPRLSSGEIRRLAERQAQVQAVRDFEPSLHSHEDDSVLRLLHEARIEAAGFLEDTLAYCATASGLVYPIEFLIATTSSEIDGERKREDKSSHIHILYSSQHAGSTMANAQSILERLGFEVTSAQAPPEKDSRWNRLYHHPLERGSALRIQAALKELVNFRLLTSSDPNRTTFTLWIVD